MGWRRWWCEKHKLPANHELVQTMTVAGIQLEYFEDLVFRRQEIQERLDDEDEDIETEEQEALFKQLNKINKALGHDEAVQDELIDKWERELAEGRMPDLDEGLPSG